MSEKLTVTIESAGKTTILPENMAKDFETAMSQQWQNADTAEKFTKVAQILCNPANPIKPGAVLTASWIDGLVVFESYYVAITPLYSLKYHQSKVIDQPATEATPAKGNKPATEATPEKSHLENDYQNPRVTVTPDCTPISSELNLAIAHPVYIQRRKRGEGGGKTAPAVDTTKLW